MAMLPVLLNMVDEIYNNLDDQSKNFQDSIPLLFVPQRAGGGFGPGKRLGNGCPCRSQLGACNCKPTSDDFQVAIDVKSYKPEEISVKVKDREIIVEGKHDEREDEHGFISRQFSRRYFLPKEFDVDTVASALSAVGTMTIKASKPQPPAVETNERIIPIQRVPTYAEAISVKPEQGWEKVEAAGEISKEAESKE